MSRAALLSALVACVAVAAAAAEELPLRDPMRPYAAPADGGAPRAGPRELRLTAVLISPQRRIAVINGGIYGEGEEVDGARVVRIEPDAVRVRRGAQDLVVPLNGRAEPEINEGDSAT